MINLFEYQNKEKLSSSPDELENFLDELWRKRERTDYFKRDDEKVEFQRFIQFIRKTDEIKSNKYVGVIFYNDQKINLLPKIFYDENVVYTDDYVTNIHNHVLWWLSYCRKIKFPNYQTSLQSRKSDLFEILIYMFSKYTRELLSSSIFRQYEEIAGELDFIKGRLNSSAYVNENISRGRWHKLNCTYDSFIVDNSFNQIIKYVAKMLLSKTKDKDNIKYLREIIFLLDDVNDVSVSAEMCSRITFNPMFKDFEIVRDYCYLFLNNSISVNYKNDLKLFAFFLPMDYLFEDFLYGFIKKELPELKVTSQSTAVSLDESGLFGLKPDMIIELNGHKIIADAKYKIIYKDKFDSASGISQSDLYQMIAYATRYKITNIFLFYPGTIKKQLLNKQTIFIRDKLADEQQIKIEVVQLPVINHESFLEEINKSGKRLSVTFEALRVNLRDKLEMSFKN